MSSGITNLGQFYRAGYDPARRSDRTILDYDNARLNYRVFGIKLGEPRRLIVALEDVATWSVEGSSLVIDEPSFKTVPEVLLHSTNFQSFTWPDGVLRKKCFSAVALDDHSMRGCTCGIHACESPESLERLGYVNWFDQWPVLAQVRQWGEMLFDRNVNNGAGMVRSEFAELVWLQIHPKTVLGALKADDIVEALGHRYKVPIEIREVQREPVREGDWASVAVKALSGQNIVWQPLPAGSSFTVKWTMTDDESVEEVEVDGNAYSKACPDDTDGDGDCGNARCPNCGKYDQNGALKRNRDYIGLQTRTVDKYGRTSVWKTKF